MRMRKGLIATVVCSALGVGVVFAGQRPPGVDRALHRQYPDANTEVTDSRVINGVKVFDVRVTTHHGQARSVLTEAGDFILTGLPRSDNDVSKPAMDTLNGLFKFNQQDVAVYHVTSYLVDVKSEHRYFRLSYDPVGRLQDIYNEAEIRKEELSNYQRVDDRNYRLKADDYARQYMEGDKVEAVYRAPEADDFFTVAMRERDGREARITLNNDGRIFSQREEIDPAHLPPPVFASMDQMFDRTRIDRAYRYEYEYYEFDKTTSGGDLVTIRIRPNGDVLTVQNRDVIDFQRDQFEHRKDFR